MSWRDTVDLEDLLNTTRAAEFARVTPDVIRQWRRRGHLTSVGRDDRGHPLYRPIDILKAEAKTRRHAIRNVARTAALHDPLNAPT